MAPGGICGFARFDGTPPETSDREELHRMVAASAWRARAGGAETVARRHMGPAAVAALGGASLASCEATGTIVVAADARLVRKDALARTLAAELGRAELPDERSPSDAELILAAYRAWGTACPDRLLGDFAFALWDGAAGTLFCARDPAGVRPLHYTHGPDGVVCVASDAGQLLATGVPKVLDGFYLIDFLTGNFREQARSPWAEIRRLLPGHSLVADDRGLRGRRYWHPDRGSSLGSVPSPGSETEWVQTFRDLLETVVADHLEDSGEAAALMTSGGVDSSVVAAFAQKLYREGRISARPIAVIDVFERLSACDESEHSTALVESIGIDAEWLVADDLSDLCPEPSWGGPIDSPFSMPGELVGRALDRARQHGCRVVTTGFGGDSLFDGARLQFFDHVRRARFDRAWRWVQGARRRSVPWHRAVAGILLPPLLTAGGRRRLARVRGRGRYWQVPAWLNGRWRASAERRLNDQWYPRRFRSFARQRQYEDIIGLAQQGPGLTFWSDNAARRGIEPRFPLLDRRLGELVLRAPMEVLGRPEPGGTKWLLREAASGSVPESVRRRPDKGGWADHTRDALCHRLERDLWERFDGRSHLSRLGLVDDRALIEGLERLCDRASGRSPASDGLLLMFAHLLEWWLTDRISGDGSPAPPRFEDLDAWERDDVLG